MVVTYLQSVVGERERETVGESLLPDASFSLALKASKERKNPASGEEIRPKDTNSRETSKQTSRPPLLLPHVVVGLISPRDRSPTPDNIEEERSGGPTFGSGRRKQEIQVTTNHRLAGSHFASSSTGLEGRPKVGV